MQLKIQKSNETVRGAFASTATARLFSLVASLFMLSITFPAHAALTRVGPVSNAPTIGGYPTWYQDSTGLTLEFCDPMTQSEVDGGWCLLLPGDPPSVPEIFPTSFFDEHFYFAADANLNPAQGGKAKLVIALEGAFATGPATPGQQQTFTRIRVLLTPVAVSGKYRFIHPYGEYTLDGVAGDRIFFTEDIGVACTLGDFTCALSGGIGPFLVPAITPGGAEIPAVTASRPVPDADPAHFGGLLLPTAYPQTGKSYLADPARNGPVTGSPLPPFTDSSGALRDHNIFRLEGPAGSNIGGPGVDFLETTNFTLQGRVFEGTVPGNVTVDRASYTNGATGTKLDVFASGSETVLSRMPATPSPAPVLPQLSFFAAPCAADAAGALTAPALATEGAMLGDGKHYWSQVHPAAIPTSVCVKDAAARDVNLNVVPAYYQAGVTDEVAITSAIYDTAARTLTVSATSSDTVAAPTLTLDGFALPLTAGSIVVPSVLAPPAAVRILSSAQGSADLLVTTGVGTTPPPPAPADTLTAVNDAYTILEDSGLQAFAVLTNDIAATGGIVTIVSAPRLGSASVNPDGTIAYTPNLNASGLDGFTYQVAVGTTISNIANVAVTITAVNDAPVAVDDGPFPANAGVATALPNVLLNDTDPDGTADIVNAVSLSTPVGPGAATVTGGAGGLITFTASVAGTYTFTYTAQDAAGALSAPATVTVNVITADIVAMSKADFVSRQNRWTIVGSSSVPNQTITLTYVDGSAAGFVLATDVAVDAAGAWKLDLRNVTGTANPTTLGAGRPTRIRATSAFTGSGTIAIKYN